MVGVRCVICLWIVLVSHTWNVHSDMKILEKFEGDSVLLPCALQRRDPPPFGVYLKRRWLRPSNVLFMYQMSEFSVDNDGDRDRTSVAGDPSDHVVNVTISQLRVDDTDQYDCVFVVENPLSEDLNLPGDTTFFLLVRAGQSDCSSYSALLYVLSSAVGVVLVLLLTLVAFWVKSHRRAKARCQGPIYEEMAGVLRTPHRAEKEASEYKNIPVKKSGPENHYETPRGLVCPRKVAQE